MATVEVVGPVALIASKELVKVIDEAVKVTEIKPMTEKATKEEAPTEEVPAIKKTVDESPATFENFAEELIVATSAVEPEAELALLKSEEEASQVPDEAEQGKEVSIAEAPVEAASAKEEAPVEVPEQNTTSVEESIVRGSRVRVSLNKRLMGMEGE